nr:MAG TPA_asm: hypothetical protein [Caudoviricetes sp.]
MLYRTNASAKLTSDAIAYCINKGTILITTLNRDA